MISSMMKTLVSRTSDWVLSKFGLSRITGEDWEKGRVAIQQEREEANSGCVAQERAPVCDGTAKADPVLAGHEEWFEDRCW